MYFCEKGTWLVGSRVTDGMFKLIKGECRQVKGLTRKKVIEKVLAAREKKTTYP